MTKRFWIVETCHGASLLLLPFLKLHQQKRVGAAFLGQVGLVVNNVIDGACFGFVEIGKIPEVKAFLGHLLPCGEALALLVQLLKDIVVPRQNRVDVAHDVGLLVGFLVVVAVAARVAAKLLIDAPDDRLTAIEAFPFLFHILNFLVVSYLVNT